MKKSSREKLLSKKSVFTDAFLVLYNLICFINFGANQKKIDPNYRKIIDFRILID
jgi:hypothetical protein